MNLSSSLRPVNLEINLDNLKHNIREIRRYVGQKTQIMAVVKANAYGHGSIESSRIFLENGADCLAVSILAEGIELRKAGIGAEILLLNYTQTKDYPEVIRYDLLQTVYEYEGAKLLSEAAASMGKLATIHIKIDTGMGRLGFLPNKESIETIRRISLLSNIKIEGIFTHFSKSEEEDKTYTRFQYDKFQWVINELEKVGTHIPIKHVSNSGAVLDLEDYNLDMVRPGIILYGHYPTGEPNNSPINIKPAMALKSRISHIKKVPEGTAISYNQLFITDRESTIATLPIGYGDGYSRMLTGKARVFLKGQEASVVGNICMDQMMIDVTEVEGLDSESEVILFNYREGGPTVEEIARTLGTVNYEILCMMGRRIPRVYTESGRIVNVVDYLK